MFFMLLPRAVINFCSTHASGVLALQRGEGLGIGCYPRSTLQSRRPGHLPPLRGALGHGVLALSSFSQCLFGRIDPEIYFTLPAPAKSVETVPLESEIS